MVAWIAMFREFTRSGASDKLAWATQYEKDNRGTDYDRYTAGTIRVNLCHIEWANAHLNGGAKSCASINHIIKSKGKKETTTVVEPLYEYTTRTLDGKTLVRELVAQGVARKTADAVAKKLGFRK